MVSLNSSNAHKNAPTPEAAINKEPTNPVPPAAADPVPNAAAALLAFVAKFANGVTKLERIPATPLARFIVINAPAITPRATPIPCNIAGSISLSASAIACNAGPIAFKSFSPISIIVEKKFNKPTAKPSAAGFNASTISLNPFAKDSKSTFSAMSSTVSCNFSNASTTGLPIVLSPVNMPFASRITALIAYQIISPTLLSIVVQGIA